LWRKAIDHDPRFITVTDKQAAKDWIGAQDIDVVMPETYWCGDNANDIPCQFFKQEVFVKATHGCGTNIEIPKGGIDPKCVVKRANEFLLINHGLKHREWAYLHIPRRLIIEQKIPYKKSLLEFKFFTYGSQVEFFLFIDRGPPGRASRWFKTADGTYERSSEPTSVGAVLDDIPLPPVFADALRVASEIGAHFDHMRVDFLTDGNSLYLGELTVYHNAGKVDKQGHILDAAANRSWDIRKSWFLTTPQKGWRAVYAAALLRTLNREHAA
jgi:hypothetical protein